ncbi:MAG: bifunctional metallophosphatase/5'-nucleotidase [Opitutus sp.]|nr:bifunctional metallophosphatase/5'-nucleotidase [Opitutus sp.]
MSWPIRNSRCSAARRKSGPTTTGVAPRHWRPRLTTSAPSSLRAARRTPRCSSRSSPATTPCRSPASAARRAWRWSKFMKCRRRDCSRPFRSQPEPQSRLLSKAGNIRSVSCERERVERQPLAHARRYEPAFVSLMKRHQRAGRLLLAREPTSQGNPLHRLKSLAMFRFSFFFLLAACVTRIHAAAPAPPEAVLVVVGDLHSAYERSAQLVARVDRLRAENAGVPLAILIDGDSLEYGNVVARRTSGAIDFALFAALAKRAPTILNLGNHEPEFHDVPETVKRLRATGLVVIGGNLRDRESGRPFAPASTTLKLGAREATLVGVTTDRLATYRAAIRPQLDLADPVVWAKANFPALLKDAALPIVLSHAGLRADREMLPLVPDGTLFAGAHDHLRFVHRAGGTVYFHSGSWLEFVSIARLRRTDGALRWEVEQVRLNADDPADPGLAKIIRETLAQQLTPEETAVVGRTPRAFGPGDAAQFAVEAARRAAAADVALVGATTFGAGLPAGDVTRFAFDACVRFDGPLFTAEVEGGVLKKILARANQGPDTPFAERGGENLVAAVTGEIVAGRTYRLVTTDWIAKNARNYLGDTPPALTERPKLTLKAAVLAALRP